MKIGFMGLGIMGQAMAGHLLKHTQAQGQDLIVYNRSREKMQPLLEAGAQASDPTTLGAQADVLFTMLAHPQAVKDCALRESGFLASMRPGTLWVDCSTVNPSFARSMAARAAERGVHYIDAPVAGSKPHAEQGQLVFLVGGEQDDIATATPWLEAMGSKVVPVGGHGQGTALKLVLNLLLGASMSAFAEALVLGQALGITQEMLFKVLIGGPVTAPFLAMKHEKLQNADYAPEFPLEWMRKDLHMVSQAAYEAGVALPCTQSVEGLYALAAKQGLGREDFSAVYGLLAEEHG